eukprot:CCRYP_013726-RA/>CCRYP_013726-RA protein AED:0.42 eAED:0.42 QI:94/1/0.4/1/0.75/0.6/5/0/398
MPDTQAELQEYLKANNLNAIFVSIVEAILIEKPDNPIGFMTEFLLHKFPEETKHITTKEAEKPPSLVVAKEFNKEDLSETESDESSVNTITTAPRSIDEQQPPRRKKRRESVCAEKIQSEGKDFELNIIDKSAQESSRILQILKNNLFFSHLDEIQMDQVVHAMFLVDKQDGDIIINQGDDGDNFYIIDAGSVDVFIKTIGSDDDANMVKTCMAGDSFGELAIMYNAPRAASCIAKGDVRLWALDRVAFKVILMKTTTAQRESYRGFLTKVPIFSELTEYEILTIADALLEECFEDNVTICNQGDIGDKFYLIKDGTAVCSKTGPDGTVIKVAELSSGSYFGEISLLTTKSRQATVTSQGLLKCLSLDRRTFNRVMGPLQDILMRNIEHYNKFQASNI